MTTDRVTFLAECPSWGYPEVPRTAERASVLDYPSFNARCGSNLVVRSGSMNRWTILSAGLMLFLFCAALQGFTHQAWLRPIGLTAGMVALFVGIPWLLVDLVVSRRRTRA